MTDARSSNDSTTDVAASKASDVASSAQASAEQLADEASSHAQRLLDEGRQAGRSEAEQQSERLARAARSMSSELRSMANAGEGPLSGLVAQGADQVDAMVQRYDRDGLDGVASEVRRLARRRPLVFIGATFAAGLAAGRLVRNTDTDDLKDAVTDELGDDQSAVSTSWTSTPSPTTASRPRARAERR